MKAARYSVEEKFTFMHMYTEMLSSRQNGIMRNGETLTKHSGPQKQGVYKVVLVQQTLGSLHVYYRHSRSRSVLHWLSCTLD